MSGFGSDYNEQARTISDQSRGGGRNKLHLLGKKKKINHKKVYHVLLVQ